MTARFKGTPGRAFRFASYDEVTKYTYSTPVTADGSWQLLTLTFTLDASSKYHYVFLDTNGDGQGGDTVYWDDVCLYDMDTTLGTPGKLSAEYLHVPVVMLKKSGQQDITATNVQLLSPSEIECRLAIPSSAGTGTWDLVVQNGYGMSATRNNAFQVNAAPPQPSPLSTWYLAEGTTAWGFSTYISIQNPNPSAVRAKVTYMPKGARQRHGDGQPAGELPDHAHQRPPGLKAGGQRTSPPRWRQRTPARP